MDSLRLFDDAILFSQDKPVQCLSNLSKWDIPGNFEQGEMHLIGLFTNSIREMIKELWNGQTNTSKSLFREGTNQNKLRMLFVRPRVTGSQEQLPWPYP